MEPQAPVTPVVPVSPVVAPTKPSKMPWIIAGGLGVIVLIMLGVVAFLALNALNKQSQNNNQTPAPVAQQPDDSAAGGTMPTTLPDENSADTNQVTYVDFYKGPFTQADTTAGSLNLVKVTVKNPANSSNVYYRAMDAILAGPQAEQATDLGLRTSFALTGTSTCDGAEYTITAGASAEDLIVEFCKDVDTSIQQSTSSEGGYAGITLRMGGNVIGQVRQSMIDNGAATVSVKDKTGACYMPDSGANVDCN